MSDTTNGHNGHKGPPQPRNGPLSRDEQRRQILAYVLARRSKTALRPLADEIGISKSALHQLLAAEREPAVLREPQDHYGIWPKIVGWYVKDRVQREGALPDEATTMALVALQVLNGIPEAERGEAIVEYVRDVQRLYDRHLAPYPDWLVRLRAELGLDEPGGGDAAPRPGDPPRP